MKLYILLLVLLISISDHSASQENNEDSASSLLWEISGKGLVRSSYLFGTHHLFNGKFIDTIETFKKCINDADVIMVETDMKNIDSAMMMDKMTLKEDEYYSYTDPEDEKMVIAYFDNIIGSGSYYFFLRFKPIFLAITLEYFDNINEMNKTKGTAMKIDEYVQDFAVKNSKSIIFLETGLEQISLLSDSIPFGHQMLTLVEYVRYCNSGYKPSSRKLDSCYKQMDLECLTSSSLFGSMSGTYSRVLLQNRNMRWMKIIKERIAKNSIFMAVGAMHLIGQEGLIELLRSEGYTVTPIRLS